MMKNKATYLSAVLASSFALSPLSIAIGQELSEAEKSEVEVIEVTGIKRSMFSANDAKRSSDSITDGISAEDLGVFPDGNVAESLQRITGVSIDRSGGEGRFITVRGLGPEFNTVLANGRMLATENAGREFSLDVLSADLINGAQVYKSSNAALTEGAIGGTVDITTWRPFQIEGSKMIGSVSGTYDTNSEKNDIKASTLYSTTSDDDTMGFLFSLAYSQRTARLDSVFSDGYRDMDFDANQTANGQAITGAKTLAAQRFQLFNQDRERLGGTAVFQWKPADDHEITIDGLFSLFDVDDTSYQAAFPLDAGRSLGFSDVVVDSNNFVTSATKDGRVDVIKGANPRDTQTFQFGYNHKWTINENLSMVADIAYSEAEGNGYGKDRFFIARADTDVTFNMVGDFPQITTGQDLTDPSIWESHVVAKQGNDTNDSVLEAKVDFDYVIDDMGVLYGTKFGLYYSDREKDINASLRGPCATCYNGGKINYTDTSFFSTFKPSNYMSEASGNFTNAWIDFNFDDFPAYLTSEAALSQLSAADRESIEARIAAGGFEPQANPGGSGSVTEESLAAYFQLSLMGERWDALIGARYIETDQVSTGQFQEIIELVDIVDPDGFVENRIVTLSDPTATSFNNSYSELLPSASIRIELDEEGDLLLRGAFSESLTRPTISSLSTRISYSTNVGAERVSASNPNLTPFKSTNYDMSLEWYFNDVGSLTFAAFNKQLDSFLTVSTEPVTILGVEFGDTRPRNGGEGEITGYEIAYQQVFDTLPAPFDGLGIQANYTNIDSSADYSDLGNSEELTLEGLSEHNANLILFYEKEQVKVRFAYNYRSDFINEAVSWIGGPKSTDNFGQLDFRASYDINDNFQVFVEGINITNETLSQFYDLDKKLLSGYEDFGSRYALGVRAQF
ncbi:TonB-dependent receptor [Thalassotalea sp. PP2-459]|uniref:TonB-dependent receptor n=1 Tax=Thalassotalea sp. PP2-459 TaxID=1742724 RepID=UPI0020CA1AC0|nr:TonB-dependent receptor [Thalassotalea sp. PP2-459]